MENELGYKLTEAEKDVLDLATCVYVADRHVQRQSGTDAARILKILIALRQPDRLDPDTLTSLLHHLSSDYVSFDIVRRKETDDDADFPAAPERSEHEAVCLLSGGADSFGGTIEACEKQLAPIIVGHYTSDSLPQSQLAGSIQRRYGTDVSHCFIGNLQTAGRGLAGRPVESSMRLRSFLYVAIASTVSATQNIKEVWMSENGIMTPGIPFAPSRVGPYTTRTTHPVFVQSFSEWYRSVTSQAVRMRNPYAYFTKSEIVKQVGSRGFATDLRKTVSCFRRQFAVRMGSGHCGYCVPCLIRRAAFLHSDMVAYDDPGGYLADFLDLDDLPASGKADLVDMAAFSTDFTQMSDSNLTLNYVDLFALQDPERIAKTIETLRRFSHEFLDVLQRHGKANLKAALGIR